jgi:hypothetical protein
MDAMVSRHTGHQALRAIMDNTTDINVRINEPHQASRTSESFQHVTIYSNIGFIIFNGQLVKYWVNEAHLSM